MSASNRFETDVFFSFAEADDVPLMGGEAGWVSRFRATLQAFAKQILGRPLALADEDGSALGPIGSATFVAVLSPSYLQATDELADLATFADLAATAAGSAGGGEQRVFKVVKSPVPPEQIPEPVKPCLEHAFFDIDETTGAPREFRPEFDRESERRFNSKTYELAQDLCALVRRLQETGPMSADGTVSEAGGEPPEAAPPGAPAGPGAASASETAVGATPPGPELPALMVSPAPGLANGNPRRTVYLAQTSSDQAGARDLVRGELLQLGHTVLPDRDLPLAADELTRTIDEALVRSDLAIHLIGSAYGLVPEGESRSIVEVQCEMSGARGMPRLIWISPDSPPTDDRQADFIATLESHAVTRRSTDLLRTPIEALKTAIRDTLTGLDEAEPDPATGDRVRIYVICDQDDYRATKQLADFLTETGFQVWRPTFGGEAPDRIKLHKKRLRECDANIVYYGRASDTWFELKIEDWDRAAAWRAGQMLVQAVFVGAPLTDHKRGLRVADAVLIEGADEFSPRTLDPFLERVQRDKAVG